MKANLQKIRELCELQEQNQISETYAMHRIQTLLNEKKVSR